MQYSTKDIKEKLMKAGFDLNPQIVKGKTTRDLNVVLDVILNAQVINNKFDYNDYLDSKNIQLLYSHALLAVYGSERGHYVPKFYNSPLLSPADRLNAIHLAYQKSEPLPSHIFDIWKNYPVEQIEKRLLNILNSDYVDNNKEIFLTEHCMNEHFMNKEDSDHLRLKQLENFKPETYFVNDYSDVKIFKTILKKHSLTVAKWIKAGQRNDLNLSIISKKLLGDGYNELLEEVHTNKATLVIAKQDDSKEKGNPYKIPFNPLGFKGITLFPCLDKDTIKTGNRYAYDDFNPEQNSHYEYMHTPAYRTFALFREEFRNSKDFEIDFIPINEYTRNDKIKIFFKDKEDHSRYEWYLLDNGFSFAKCNRKSIDEKLITDIKPEIAQIFAGLQKCLQMQNEYGLKSWGNKITEEDKEMLSFNFDEIR